MNHFHDPVNKRKLQEHDLGGSTRDGDTKEASHSVDHHNIYNKEEKRELKNKSLKEMELRLLTQTDDAIVANGGGRNVIRKQHKVQHIASNGGVELIKNEPLRIGGVGGLPLVNQETVDILVRRVGRVKITIFRKEKKKFFFFPSMVMN